MLVVAQLAFLAVVAVVAIYKFSLMGGWHKFQLLVATGGAMFGLYMEWNASGIALGMLGGMISWYLTYAIVRVLWQRERRLRPEIGEPPSIDLVYRPPDAPPKRPQKRAVRSDQP